MEDKQGGILRSILDKVSIVALGAMTILVFTAIVLRYVFSIGIRWTDELTNFLFIYIVFLGIAIAYRNDDHIIIQILLNVFPPRFRRVLTIVTHFANGLIMIVIAACGIPIIFGKIGQTLTPGLRIPRAYIYAALPIGTIFLLLEIGGKLKRLLKKT